jgi:hypothetical protein
MSEFWLKAAYIVVGTIFAVGVGWGTFKRIVKDVNGIGKRTRKMDVNTKLALMAMCRPEERWALAEFLRED